MVRPAAATTRWLLRRAALRWPADRRAELEREWSAEVAVLAGDGSIGPLLRQWRMVTFAGSLAVSPGEGRYGRFGVRRAAVVVAALSAYLLGLSLLQHSWYGVYSAQAEGDRPVIDDAGLAARLVVGTVALAPVLMAAAAGWLVGRRSGPAVRPRSLGLCLVAVVAAWVGVGFLLDHVTGSVAVPTMGYAFGRQPYGMVTSWVVWLVGFIAVGGWLSRAGRHRLVHGLLATVLVSAVAVTAATFAQFDAGTAPRAEAWKWFPQWLVPANPFETSPDEGALSFHSARAVIFFVSSYPHVLLAVTAFGAAYLLATRRRATTPAAALPA
ncbi:hypothetical protein [Micromonospora auratinigra]|uniref:Uncharacterized protein n=1 Tax=Micromonospora auratinigra TaxID=261654 RepID=A0A1A8ZGW8_9ACTN|nr:hypothetical protein [Micromonospora auratinigra]SBT43118.1 hypothetical protein GA0070611_2206 [Micromonospora auratinigra]